MLAATALSCRPLKLPQLECLDYPAASDASISKVRKFFIRTGHLFAVHALVSYLLAFLHGVLFMTRYTSLLATLGFVAAAMISAAAPARAEEIQWLKSIEQARQIAGQTNRLVLVHFWSTSCQPCMKLEREVFARPGTAERL
jgi:hypothetical protein